MSSHTVQQLSNTSGSPNSTINNTAIQLIYAGGTFGCHGKPLSPIHADVFLPQVQQLLTKHGIKHTTWLDNTLIKDSSQLDYHDFLHFYQLILHAYATGKRQFVLITGTDTLSYLGSFLAEAFAASDICLVITGSMLPLFKADILDTYEQDPQSDAWDNLNSAITLATQGYSGVYVCFSDHSWHAQTVQKIDSQQATAFVGHDKLTYPATSYHQQLTTNQYQQWLDKHLLLLNTIKYQQQDTPLTIYPIYCLPNTADALSQQLEFINQQSASAIILISFGAGNLPYSDKVAYQLNTAYQQECMVVCTSQCPFGGVQDAYAAGSWQYQYGVLSAKQMTIPAIYARLLWLHLSVTTADQRRQQWQ